jgi:hypothetical protein
MHRNNVGRRAGLEPGPHVRTGTIPGDEVEVCNAHRGPEGLCQIGRFPGVVREEEAGTEASEFCLTLSGGKVRKDYWKQLFEELVIMHGPCNPEAKAAHPE